jgi:flagellar hook-associated protein 3 FlgL
MTMINRVTQQTIQRSTLANVQANLATAAALQNEMSSGRKINKPSDDPSGTSDSMRLRSEQTAATQFGRNANDGNAWLSTIDTAMSATTSALRRARDLAVQSGNGALSPVGREAIAAELDGIKAQLLSLADTKYLGRTVFAGTSNAGTAFTVGTDPVTSAPTYTSTSVPGSSVLRRVSDQTTVRVDADASAVFGDGAGSAFALIDSMTSKIRAGGTATSDLANVDTRMSAILSQQAGIGARQNQVESAQSVLADRQLAVTTQLSTVEDVDLAEMTLKIQQQSVTYQGALAAAAKSLQPSLMDYLK